MGQVSTVLGQRVYLDTNIIIYIVEGFPAYLDQMQALMAAVNTGEVVAVTSELTLAETLVKPLKDHQPALQQAYKFILTSTPTLEVTLVSRGILEDAAQLRADSKLQLPDAIHLATALQYQCDSFLTNDIAFKSLNLPQVKMLADVDLT